MAAARRILTLFTSRSPSNVLLHKEISARIFPWNPVHKEIFDGFSPSINPLFRGSNFGRRGLGTQAEHNTTSTEGSSSSSSTQQETTTALSASDEENPGANISAMSNLKVSPRHDMAMVFTCKVCETRSVKTTCKESYEKGVVVVRCGGCNNLHLIADRLGWFGEPSSVEDFLAAQGEEFKRGSADTLNLTLEDLAGSGTKP